MTYDLQSLFESMNELFMFFLILRSKLVNYNREVGDIMSVI